MKRGRMLQGEKTLPSDRPARVVKFTDKVVQGEKKHSTSRKPESLFCEVLSSDSSAEEAVQVFPIQGDGRCMFRAIARTIAHAEKRSISDKMETEDADFMRQAAWQVICVDKLAAFEQAKVIKGDMLQYCASMKSPSFFGGEPELFVLSELLWRPITIYVPQQLLYNGHNHYYALLD